MGEWIRILGSKEDTIEMWYGHSADKEVVWQDTLSIPSSGRSPRSRARNKMSTEDKGIKQVYLAVWLVTQITHKFDFFHLAVCVLVYASHHSENSVKQFSIMATQSLQEVELLFRVSIYLRLNNNPGWCGSVDWVLACEPNGHQFDSQSGHMPGL